MRINLHDNAKHLKFAPLTLTRPVGDLRMGIFTNVERWEQLVENIEIGFETIDYLSSKYPSISDAITVNACVIPTKEVVEEVKKLKGNEELVIDDQWIARSGTGEIIVKYDGVSPIFVDERWELFQKNDAVLQLDFDLITKGRTSVQLSSTNTIIGDPTMIFLEQGAKVEASILNTTTGPIYIGKDAEIMEGSLIRGGLALCDHAVLKLGAKVYGATTVGPYCKVGGEVNNVVFQSYSNKGHDGFLGNSLIGEWCNLGADTNTSNLKNNYGTVKTYDYESSSLLQTSVQFMGLTMGDHSKCGINTMFNTASVVGVSANVYGSGFPEKFIPSFSWGDTQTKFDLNKAIEAINNMMSRRNLELSSDEIAILSHLFDRR